MAAATTVLGEFTGQVGKKRQHVELSHDWETVLKREVGVIPPRTHHTPFIAKPHPALEGREIPIYNTGALQSQIVPGGPLDPYCNPVPTAEQYEKERKRMAALAPHVVARIEAKHSEKGVEPNAVMRLLSRVMPGDLSSLKEPLRLRDGTAVETLEDYEESHLERQRDRLRQLYRRDPAAEPLRIAAFARLHPELKINEEKVKHLDLPTRVRQY